MSTSYPPHYAYPSAPPLQRALPSPPRLHWGWVLLLSVLTFGLFGSVWLLVQANWIRRMRAGTSTGFWFALANLAVLPCIFFYAVIMAMAARIFPESAAALVGALVPMARILGFVLYVCAAFTMRSELQAEPIGIPLGGVMTFFFAPLYFQYHLRDFGTGYVADGGLGLNATPVAAAGAAYPTQPIEYPPPAKEPLPPFGG